MTRCQLRCPVHINQAHDDLAGRGIDVSDIRDLPRGRFVYFADPDGNRWAVQQIVHPA